MSHSSMAEFPTSPLYQSVPSLRRFSMSSTESDTPVVHTRRVHQKRVETPSSDNESDFPNIDRDNACDSSIPRRQGKNATRGKADAKVCAGNSGSNNRIRRRERIRNVVYKCFVLVQKVISYLLSLRLLRAVRTVFTAVLVGVLTCIMLITSDPRVLRLFARFLDLVGRLHGAWVTPAVDATPHFFDTAASGDSSSDDDDGDEEDEDEDEDEDEEEDKHHGRVDTLEDEYTERELYLDQDVDIDIDMDRQQQLEQQQLEQQKLQQRQRRMARWKRRWRQSRPHSIVRSLKGLHRRIQQPSQRSMCGWTGALSMLYFQAHEPAESSSFARRFLRELALLLRRMSDAVSRSSRRI